MAKLNNCDCSICTDARRLEQNLSRLERLPDPDQAWHPEHWTLPYPSSHVCECGAEWAGSSKHSDYCPKYYKEKP